MYHTRLVNKTQPFTLRLELDRFFAFAMSTFKLQNYDQLTFSSWSKTLLLYSTFHEPSGNKGYPYLNMFFNSHITVSFQKHL